MTADRREEITLEEAKEIMSHYTFKERFGDGFVLEDGQWVQVCFAEDPEQTPGE